MAGKKNTTKTKERFIVGKSIYKWGITVVYYIGCSWPVKALNVWMMPSQIPAGNSQLILAVSLGTPKYPKSTGIHCLCFYICRTILHVHICKLFGKKNVIHLYIYIYICYYILLLYIIIYIYTLLHIYIYIYLFIYLLFYFFIILYYFLLYYIYRILLFIAPPGWAAGASAAVTTQPLTWIRPCRSAVLSGIFPWLRCWWFAFKNPRTWVIKCPHWTSPNHDRYMVNQMATIFGDVQ